MEAILLKKEYICTEGMLKLFVTKHKNGNIEILRQKSSPDFEKKCIDHINKLKF